jgi:pimeloyl-ACP methyl ester carboxylesterase
VPYVERGGARIWYTGQGTGFPMLTLAPGGMRSSVPLWEMAAISPLTACAGQYRMIAMDQRNAGRSGGRRPVGRVCARSPHSRRPPSCSSRGRTPGTCPPPLKRSAGSSKTTPRPRSLHGHPTGIPAMTIVHARRNRCSGEDGRSDVDR